MDCEYSGQYQYICSRLSRNWVESVSQTSRSKEIGFLLNFCENIPYFIYQKPEGYSLEYAASVLPEQEYAEETMSPDNIIVIMNESFTDLGFLGELEANQEYLPNFYRVINEENSKMGKCVTSVFGGGTSCTEFEFLTGSSMLFLGSGNAPYQQYIQSRRPDRSPHIYLQPVILLSRFIRLIR